MALTYRTRQFYRRFFRLLLTLFLVAALFLLCWVLWLRRFIIYTPDGAKLDFSLSQQWPQGQVGQQSTQLPMPDIYFTQQESTAPPVEEETQFRGYYVTVEELMEDLNSVLENILALPEGTPVLVDVKGYWGYFYYSTAVGGQTSDSFDIPQMDAFFAAINEAGLHTIARVSALRDYYFARNNVACGLKMGPGYLWPDENKSYWLDPANDTVLSYLIQTAKELQDMGFDEVAFRYFCFPDTDQVVYEGDKSQAIEKAAQTLASACAGENFTVSFVTEDPAFPLPDGNCRLYLENVAAADVRDILSAMPETTVERTVFFAQNNDTRFQLCGTIQPIIMAP